MSSRTYVTLLMGIRFEPNHYASDRGDERIVDRCNRGNKGGVENPDVDDIDKRE